MHINEKRGAFHRLKTKCEGIIPIIFWCALIFGFTEPAVAVLTLITAASHEMGHLLAIYVLGARPAGMGGRWLGLGISLPRHLSYKTEALIYAAGPAANLLCAAIGCLLLRWHHEYALLFVLLNLATAISNLLPVEGHDGYGLIRAVACGADGSERTLHGLSLTFTAALCLLSLYVVDRIGEGYFIFAVTAASLLSSMRTGLSRAKNEI